MALSRVYHLCIIALLVYRHARMQRRRLSVLRLLRDTALPTTFVGESTGRGGATAVMCVHAGVAPVQPGRQRSAQRA